MFCLSELVNFTSVEIGMHVMSMSELYNATRMYTGIFFSGGGGSF